MTPRKQPMVQINEPGSSPVPSPADHVRMLVELLRPGGPELIRRWVSALLMAPTAEREAIVNEVERSLVELYAEPLFDGDASSQECDQTKSSEPPVVHVVTPAVQREGYVEQIERSYSEPADAKRAKSKAKPKSRGAKRA
jgi:hypothetical protein